MMNTQVKGINPKARTMTRAERRSRACLIKFLYYITLALIVGLSLVKLLTAGQNALAVANVENIVMNTSLVGLCTYFIAKALYFAEKI